MSSVYTKIPYSAKLTDTIKILEGMNDPRVESLKIFQILREDKNLTANERNTLKENLKASKIHWQNKFISASIKDHEFVLVFDNDDIYWVGKFLVSKLDYKQYLVSTKQRIPEKLQDLENPNDPILNLDIKKIEQYTAWLLSEWNKSISVELMKHKASILKEAISNEIGEFGQRVKSDFGQFDSVQQRPN